MVKLTNILSIQKYGIKTEDGLKKSSRKSAKPNPLNASKSAAFAADTVLPTIQHLAQLNFPIDRPNQQELRCLVILLASLT